MKPIVALIASLMLVAGMGAAPRPNIILFVTDDQSPIPIAAAKSREARAFGFNGEKHVHTPVMDALARGGMVFTRAYVSSSVCSASRYSTLSGRYAGRSQGPSFQQLHPAGAMTRVENNTELEEDLPNLPRLLRQAGYRTGFVGKCHVIDHRLLSGHRSDSPELQSYPKGADPRDSDVSAKMKFNHDRWARRIREFGFDYANAVYAANLKELENDSANVHNAEWTTAAALEFLDGKDERPFFLYYATTIPHGPAPWNNPGGRGVYPSGLDGDPAMTGEGYVQREYPFMPSRDRIKREVREAGKDVDHAWVRWLDAAMGALVEKLKARGQYENTLIVVTSDHGAWRNGKATLYEGGVRVPLMMHWPAGIKAGSHCDELVQNVDHAPTLLELAGGPVPSAMHADGASMVPLLKGERRAIHSHLFFELGFARGVMTRDWKYIAVRYDAATRREMAAGHTFRGFKGDAMKADYYVRNKHLGHYASEANPCYFDPDQLFHLPQDPHELKNAVAEHPQVAGVLKDLLRADLATFQGRPFGEFAEAP